MSSANTKVYHCSICEDNINYNRKQYFKHIKTPEHIQLASYLKEQSKLKSRVSATLKSHKQSGRSEGFRRLRIINSDIFM